MNWTGLRPTSEKVQHTGTRTIAAAMQLAGKMPGVDMLKTDGRTAYNADHEMFRDTVRKFLEREFLPHFDRWEAGGIIDRSFWRACGDAGLLCPTVPEDLGGLGLDFRYNAIIDEEIGYAAGTLSGTSLQSDIVVDYIVEYGTDAQKAAYLPGMISGELITAIAMTEPGAGSDLQGIRTTARRDGDHYVLNGVKQFITSGQNGDVAIVMAVTDKAAGKKGISAFLVPTATPGYTVARIEDKMGQHASDTAQILFENCRIPAANRLGEEGQGLKIALSGLEGGRIGIASQAVGMARAAFEAALKYSKDRVSFGQPIFNHQAIQFKLADMATQIEAARQLIWHAASLKDAGQPCLKEAAMAKLFATEMAERVCSDAIQVHGGYGYVSDFPVERIYRDVRVCQIYEGTSEVQKILIGRALG